MSIKKEQRKKCFLNRDWVRGDLVILSAKEKKGLLIFFTILLLLFFGKIISLCGPEQDCPQLVPISAAVTEDPDFQYLDFSEKTRLGLGKYGFRTEITVDEPMVVTQDLEGTPYGGGFFGIFRDQALRDPVEKVDFAWLRRYAAFEEGKIDEIPYDEKRDGGVLLEPGTYYIAVYARNPFASATCAYTSRICPLNENSVLEIGHKARFFIIKENQKNTFEIHAGRKGQIKIATNLYNKGTLRVYDKAGRELWSEDAIPENDEAVTAYVNVERGDVLYAEISGLEIKREDAYWWDCNFIKYTY